DGQVNDQLPAHIRVHIDDDPVDFIRPFLTNGARRLSTNKGTQYFILVMTHDHSLDFDLVRAALDCLLATDSKTALKESSARPYVGCISSATKAKRFKEKLLQRGYSQKVVDKVTKPTDLEVGGKEPMPVAVSSAREILQ